jgi:hypothetical protein
MTEARFETASLFGLWQLVSLDAIRPNGEVITGWLGTKPTGFIAYDRSGSMAVQMMSGPRASDQEQEKPASFEYYAYFGTFEIAEDTQTIVHRVQGSMRADEVGISYKQNLTLSADRLILLTARHLVQGEERRNRIVWRRAGKD